MFFKVPFFNALKFILVLNPNVTGPGTNKVRITCKNNGDDSRPPISSRTSSEVHRIVDIVFFGLWSRRW